MSPEQDPELRRFLTRTLHPEREERWKTHCRVCGWPLGELTNGACIVGNCGMRPHPKEGSSRADDPLPHTTSWEQIAEDRKRLGNGAHRRLFLREMRRLLERHDPPMTVFEWEWELINATPEQQALAMGRALGYAE